jgi:hypothetical protein
MKMEFDMVEQNNTEQSITEQDSEPSTNGHNGLGHLLGSGFVKAFAPIGAVATGSPLVSWQESTDSVDFDKTTTVTRHTDERVRGHQDYVTQETHTDETLEGRFDKRVYEVVDGMIQEREARENKRANHRNLNRLLTLLGALLIGLMITWALTTPGILPATWQHYAPYAFVITILLDSGLALYGLIKHY